MNKALTGFSDSHQFGIINPKVILNIKNNLLVFNE